MYYRGISGAFVVYDITNRQSFDDIGPKWLKEVRDGNSDDVVVMLIGNKCDLAYKRAVPVDEAVEFSKKHNMFFLETSALDSTNIEQAFDVMVKTIFERGKSTLSSVTNPDNNINPKINNPALSSKPTGEKNTINILDPSKKQATPTNNNKCSC